MCDCRHTGRGAMGYGGGVPTGKRQRLRKSPQSVGGGWTAEVLPQPLQTRGWDRAQAEPASEDHSCRGEKRCSLVPLQAAGSPFTPIGGNPAGPPPLTEAAACSGRGREVPPCSRCCRSSHPRQPQGLSLFPCLLSESARLSVPCGHPRGSASARALCGQAG